MSPPIDRLRAALADRYAVEREVGAGGMATVYLAFDLKHQHRSLALKVLRPELTATIGPERFVREIGTAAQLSHPHIVPLFDSGNVNGFLYYVMPFVEGESLRQRLRREGQLAVEEALRLTRQIAAALDYAHRRGVIHRDVKPENILLHEGEPLIADFGIALAVREDGGERLTQTGFAVGTPEYMSPEQAAGDRTLDTRTDIYSLGCVLYEMLAGEPPFTGPSAQAVIAKRMVDPVPSVRRLREAVPAHVEGALNRALAKVPADRFATAAAFADALTRPEHTRVPIGLAAATRRWASRPTTLAAIGALVLALLALWLGGTWRPRPTLEPQDRQVTYTGNAYDPRLSPDGEMVAYTTLDPPSLVVHDLRNDASATLLQTQNDLQQVVWSADGASLVVQGRVDSLSGLFTIPVMGGRPRLLARLARPEHVRTQTLLLLSLTADGRYVISAGPWIYVGRDPAGIRWIGDDSVTGNGSLWRFPHRIVKARLSPDDRWLAYLALADDTSLVGWELGITSMDGKQRHIITPRGPFNISLRWSPSGDELYYAAWTSSNLANVVKVSINPQDGRPVGGPRLVYRGVLGFISADISADGRRLVYAGGTKPTNLRLVELGPGRGPPRSRPLTKGTAQTSNPAFSPSGHEIAFTRQTGNGIGIYLMSPTGGEERFVTQSSEPVLCMAFSPDGRRLAFGVGRLITLEPKDTSRVMLVDVATGLTQRVGVGSCPVWLSDTRIMAFQVLPQKKVPVVWDLSNHTETAIHLDDSTALAQMFPLAVAAPDGSGIVVAANGGLLQIGLRNGAQPRLTNQDGDWPVLWRPDGWVYFGRYQESSGEPVRLMRVHAGGGPQQLYAELPSECWGDGFISLSPTRTLAVCEESSNVSDLHVVDNFDPETARRR